MKTISIRDHSTSHLIALSIACSVLCFVGKYAVLYALPSVVFSAFGVTFIKLIYAELINGKERTAHKALKGESEEKTVAKADECEREEDFDALEMPFAPNRSVGVKMDEHSADAIDHFANGNVSLKERVAEYEHAMDEKAEKREDELEIMADLKGPLSEAESAMSAQTDALDVNADEMARLRRRLEAKSEECKKLRTTMKNKDEAQHYLVQFLYKKLSEAECYREILAEMGAHCENGHCENGALREWAQKQRIAFNLQQSEQMPFVDDAESVEPNLPIEANENSNADLNLPAPTSTKELFRRMFDEQSNDAFATKSPRRRSRNPFA